MNLERLLGNYTEEQKNFIKENRLIKTDHTLDAENRGGLSPVGRNSSGNYSVVPDRKTIEAILVDPFRRFIEDE